MSEYLEEIESITEESIVRGMTPLQVFFERYSEVSTERGDGPDFSPCFFRSKSNRGGLMRLDGWAIESFDVEKGKQAVNVYGVGCFFDSDQETPKAIGAQEIDKMLAEVRRSFEYLMTDVALCDSAITDESTTELTFQLSEVRAEIASIKLLVFTNAAFETKRKSLEADPISDIAVKCAVLDWSEYEAFIFSGSNPVVIDFQEMAGSPVQCIETSRTDGVSSYLLALDGNLVADLFQTYDNRLLESNVRTYLQARTATNKGILKTVADEPHLFFAYNNGITATASSAEFIEMGGVLHLVELTDLQIVNGGQTTASLLYAREQNKSSLENIKVQVKLNIVSDEASKGTLIPNISAYSNTQNKVTAADLISNEAFQGDIERAIKSLDTPKLDRLVAPNWFYERARGQYKSQFMYKRQSERDRLKALYPSDQSINKTDLAKFYLSVERKPYFVAKGAQKCFLEFSKDLGQKHSKDPNIITEAWAQDAIARAILFKSLDKAIASADWYKDDRGFKSQIVTYTIAVLAEYFAIRDMFLDTRTIWKQQSVPSNLLSILVELAFSVGGVLKSPPAERSVRNPAEFAKANYCWNLYVSNFAEQLDDYLERFGVSLTDRNSWMKSVKQDEMAVNDMQLWQSHLDRLGQIQEVIDFLKRTDQYSGRVDGALGRAFRAKYRDGDGQILAGAFKTYEDS